jgi:YD repeat-containing protein
MTVRKRKARDGSSRLFIDIRSRTPDGRKHRFRRDAQVQTKAAALAEERRLIVQLQASGTLEILEQEEEEAEAPGYTFSDAARHFRKTHLKHSSRQLGPRTTID